ncbi:hypothetical protein D3C71_1309160 [compost metagenome]
MIAVARILARMVENHRLARSARFLAQRGVHIELPARQQSEFDVVLDRAGRPGAIRDAGHGGEAHPGVAADDLQDRRHGTDAAHRGNVVRDGFRQIVHSGSSQAS